MISFQISTTLRCTALSIQNKYKSIRNNLNKVNSMPPTNIKTNIESDECIQMAFSRSQNASATDSSEKNILN